MTKKLSDTKTVVDPQINAKALELAIVTIGNPLFTLNDQPLNRDVKSVIGLAQIYRDFANGLEVIKPAESKV